MAESCRQQAAREIRFLLDAASGSIESTFAFPIPYRGTTVKAPPADTITTDKGCEAVQRPVLLALRDLSTPPAVENAVDDRPAAQDLRFESVGWSERLERSERQLHQGLAHPTQS